MGRYMGQRTKIRTQIYIIQTIFAISHIEGPDLFRHRLFHDTLRWGDHSKRADGF